MATVALGTPIKASKPNNKVKLTKEEVTAAINACEEKTKIDKLARDAEKNARAHLSNIFSKIFPEVKFYEDISRITPEQVAKALENVESEAAFIITKTNEKRYPSWKDEFTAIKGELAVNAIIEETPYSYGYKIVAK